MPSHSVNRFRTWLDRLRQLPPGVLLLAGVAVMLAVAWVGVAERFANDRRLAEQAAEREMATLARIFSEHALRAVQAADQLGNSIKTSMEEKNFKATIPATVIDPSGADLMLQVAVADASGNIIASNLPGGGLLGASIKDREHFRVHVAKDTGEPFVSQPVLGRVSQRWSVQVSRRMNNPDGSFAGVVVVSMDPNYFTHFYQQVDLGQRGTVAIVGRDGIIRARSVGRKPSGMGQSVAGSPSFAQVIDESAPSSGIVRSSSPSPIDGVMRVFAYHRVPKYPLVVLVGRDPTETLDEFDAWKQGYLTTAGLLSILALALALGIYRSVTSLERTTRALRKARAEAESVSQMKSQFLASMSHELRTPLQSLLGFAELIKRQTQEPRIAQFATQIFDSGDRLRRTLGNIIDMAKVEAGTLPVRIQQEPLRPLLEALCSEFRPLAERKQLELTLVIAPGAPERLETDRTLLVRVLGNLLDNAIKFTERGAIRMTVDRKDDAVVIIVADTGPGIAAETQALLFQKFHRETEFRARHKAGAGLGLALAREMVRLLDGRITVESDANSGARFAVVLPMPAAEPPLSS